MSEDSKIPADASDIPKKGWIYWLPASWQPYAKLARLDRPIGTWLLLLPTWWGLALATAVNPDIKSSETVYNFPDITYAILFGIGALVMRGAGCTWNDISDQDFDKKVARTADRPLPSGEVTTKQAIIFLIAQCLIGFFILLQFNLITQIIGASALFLVIAYPFMKRITYWPQAWLGLTFNWGILVGWASIYGDLHTAVFTLYTAGIFWTLGYDTIYAHQDKEDDALVGVKSTALKLGENTRIAVIFFYAATLGLIGVTGYLLTLPVYFWIALGLSGLHMIWQIYRLDINNPDRCLALFKANKNFGFIILLGFIASGL
ncbi:4-hydroxybenzoate octaprenyltransferase [Curvivirga aplysinae]|uniref:4-hydroxybenzoate octaprenyltransferase n=1 Tax=Curvivirga aplysinae TaxID=2529852 RepID=UPI0012BC2CAE|nr:4-hydroxybenzoate octaprenyltransferase [Curvivirga aplysinae]MTI11426.1 4-hydroxybenzoate octaprenyltransferase [Curvivirga aplysinae]